MKKIKTIEKKDIVGVVLIFLGSLIVTSIIWGNRTFSVKTLNQIIFHLKVPMEGTDNGIYQRYGNNLPVLYERRDYS